VSFVVWGGVMRDWKAEVDALVAETMAFAKSVDDELRRPAPQPREYIERIGLKPLDYGGSERDEILKRVATFRAHQQRFAREREDYAVSTLRKVKPLSS
jgi:hypothetical protein